MNERVNELAEQANEHAYSLHTRWIGSEEINLKWESCRDEKFAELIVRECARVAEEVNGDPRARKCVLEHFSVIINT